MPESENTGKVRSDGEGGWLGRQKLCFCAVVVAGDGTGYTSSGLCVSGAGSPLA